MNIREIHARMKGAAAVARLPLRSGRWSGTAGGVLGRGTGSSIDFQDQRPYLPGDDPRHVNWQAYARTGSYTMKLYREEVTPRIDLVCDLSGSMFVVPEKERRVWELLCFCLESGLRIGGHLRVHVLARAAGALPEELPLARALADDWPATPAPAAAAGGPQAPAALLADQIERVPLRAGALVVLVSDLLDESPPGRVAAALAAGRGRAIVLVPTARAESDPDWDGNVEFTDAERGTKRLDRVEPAILERYRAAYRRHFAIWREECARRGVGFARVADAGDFLAAVRAEAVPAGVIDMDAAG